MRESAVNVAAAALRFEVVGAEATRALGARIAAAIRASPLAARSPMLVTLAGDLGAGKTTLVGGMLQGFGHAGPVRSPTYTLIEPYQFGAREVQHCDLYRLRHPDELEDLGLRELRKPGALLLVEWPDKADGRLGPADLSIRLDYQGPDARTVVLDGLRDVGRDVVSRV